MLLAEEDGTPPPRGRLRRASPLLIPRCSQDSRPRIEQRLDMRCVHVRSGCAGVVADRVTSRR